jgi:hypothetical protein
MYQTNHINKWLVGAFVLYSCNVGIAQQQLQPYQPPEEKYPYENLLSQSDRAIEDATDRLLRANRTLDLVLMGTFDVLKKDLPKDADRFGRPYINTIRLLGELRGIDAQGRLFDIIDFQIDPASVPLHRPQDIEYYPAAFALGQIGGKRVIDTVWRKLILPTSDNHLRLYTWILQYNLGQDIALAVVEQKLTLENENLKAKDQTISNLKTNLESMKTILEKEEEIITKPKTKAIVR